MAAGSAQVEDHDEPLNHPALQLDCGGLGRSPLQPLAHAAIAPGPNFTFATDPAVAAQQRSAFDVVHRYEQLLNAGDTTEILALFAPDGIAEWNDKPTFSTLQEKRDAYDALFRIAKFTTVFGYAGIDVHGDTAVVRTITTRAPRCWRAARKSST